MMKKKTEKDNQFSLLDLILIIQFRKHFMIAPTILCWTEWRKIKKLDEKLCLLYFLRKLKRVWVGRWKIIVQGQLIPSANYE